MYQCWLSGVYPTRRHDDVLFSKSKKKGDKLRAKKAAAKMRMKSRGAPLRKRGDWSWYKAILNLTGWKGEGPDKNICWYCGATQEGPLCYMDASLDALWRDTIMSGGQYWLMLWASGSYMSVLWSLPGFDKDCIEIDLMHVGCLRNGAKN